tara:strand:- start:816 stop:1286 length:471 start_codon:yes stop_codon:yes gene_type:complete
MDIDPKFPKHWRRYLIQISYAAASVFFITITLSNNRVITANIGATAFIVFVMPNNIAAEPKRIIGGHFLSFFIGSCFAFFPFMNAVIFKVLWFWLSVGITILFMVVLDLKHLPAGGTALGMTLIAYSSTSVIIIFISVLFLAIVGHLSRPYLKDLL